jgi:hypothetical protein
MAVADRTVHDIYGVEHTVANTLFVFENGDGGAEVVAADRSRYRLDAKGLYELRHPPTPEPDAPSTRKRTY